MGKVESCEKDSMKEKSELHPRNKHRERYDFKLLIISCPELGQFVKLNEYKDESIDFFNPEAVKMLNKALLKHYYGIDSWDIPKNYLCPPIPGRADYIHHIADLLYRNNPEFLKGKIPAGTKIKCLDIGVGANCVYPIIGNKEYGWSFIGSDIDKVSIESANKIIEMNPSLKGKIELRLQHNPNDIFYGIIHKNELFDLSICNPPFHSSLAEAQSGTLRKLRNLKQKKITNPIQNFGGQTNELWCEGGEEKFIGDMIYQSKQFSTSCFWFSTLISKESNLKNAYKALKTVEAAEIKTIPMSQGNKISRIVAWTFLTREQQNKWSQRY
jgi:23S rRNA (adenine1618-N6)-methyltransferase